MQVKTCPITVKTAGTHEGADEGIVEAIVAAYNVDSVGDQIIPGAFKASLARHKDAGNRVPFVWSHQSDDPDSYIGEVIDAEERDEGLWVRARLDIDEPKAAKVYKLLKGRRVSQFSFAYTEVDARPATKSAASGALKELHELDIHECGPTMVGANQATSLLAVKHERAATCPTCAHPLDVTVKSAVGSHSTDTADSAWDGPGNEAKLPEVTAEIGRAMYAWRDPDGDATSKGSWKFPHHFVRDGKPGPASTQACLNGIAILNGGRGGADIPDTDRKGVYAHLAKHLRDAGKEPPALAGGDSDSDSSGGDGESSEKTGTVGRKDADTLDLDAHADAFTAAIRAAALDFLRDASKAGAATEVAPPTTETESDDAKATPDAAPATEEEPPAAAQVAAEDAPASEGTADGRLLTELDLLEVELDEMTD